MARSLKSSWARNIAVLALGFAFILPAVPAGAGLIGYWDLNELSGTVTDKAGPPFTNSSNALTGGGYGQSSVPAGTYGAITVTPAQAAAFGTAISFPGNAAFALGTAPSSDIGLLAGDFTVMGWLNSASLAGERVFMSTSGGGMGWKIATSGTALRFTTFGVVDMNAPGYTATTGNWFHYAVSLSGTSGTRTATFYANGNLLGTATSSNLIASTGTMSIGSSGGGAEYYQGLLDEVRVYDQVLTQAQIQAAAVPAPPFDYTLTWNDADNNWGTANWTSVPAGGPAFPNAANIAAVVNNNRVVVEGNYSAYSLAVGPTAEVNIGPGNTLNIASTTDATGTGILSFGAGSSLVTRGGTVATLMTSGNTTVNTSGAVFQVNTLNDQNTPGTFFKQGAGALILDNSAGLSDAGDTTLQVDAGLVRAIGPNPLAGSTQVVLNGGHLALQGIVTTTNNQVRYAQYNGIVGGTYLTTIDDGLLNGVGDGLLNYTPTTSGTWTGTMDPNNRGDNYSFLFTGYFQPQTSGTQQFWYEHDDDGIVWLDVNRNGEFEASAGERLISRGCCGWDGPATVNLTAGQRYAFAIGYTEGGGGDYGRLDIATPTLARARANPTAAGGVQNNLWASGTFGAVSAASTDVDVLASGYLSVQNDVSATPFGALTINSGATLNTAGTAMTFTGITLNGGGTIGISAANNVTAPTLTDGGAAAAFVKSGTGTLRLNTITAVDATDFRVNAGTLSSQGPAPLGAADDLILAGGTFEARGAPTPGITNALSLRGYNTLISPDVLMNLHNNGGLMATDPNARVLFTRGTILPWSDTDFLSTGAVGHTPGVNDYFMNLWFGYLNVTTPGSYEFRYGGQDDRGMIWLDLNRDGVFASNTGTLATNNGELLAWQDAGTKTVTLAAGTYMFAVGHGEVTGGSNLQGAYIRVQGWAGQALISPASPTQAGLWSTDVAAQVDMSTTNVTVLPNTTGSGLRVVSEYGGVFGNLSIGTNANLTLSGNKITFANTAFTPGSTLLAGINGAHLGNVTTSGGQSNIGSSIGLTTLGGAYISPIVTVATYNDQGIANSTMRIYNGATLELDNTTPGTIVAGSTSFRVEAGSLLRSVPTDAATLPLGAGSPRVTLAGGTFALRGQEDGGSVPNALAHTGYHTEQHYMVNLDGTDGLPLREGVLARVPYNRVRFTDAAAFFNRGLYPQSDTEFINSGAIGQGDNYTNVWLGYLNVTTPGNYEFRIGGDDDRSAIWLDLNRDGVFRSSNGGLETNNGELLAWEDAGTGNTKTVNLAVGQYRFAVVQGEFGGGSNIHAYIKSPTMPAQALIKPGDAAQAGLWSFPTLGNVNATNTNVTVTAGGTISALTDGTATLGKLNFEGGATAANANPALPNILTVSGGGTVRFPAGTDLTRPQPIVSYAVAAGQVGNQVYTGSLGMDFDLMQPTVLSSFGIFDSGADGLSSTLNVRLYDRTNTATPLATLTFSPGDPGTLVGGSRYKSLATPLVLPAGFRGSIVASGFTATDPNGNLNPAPWTYDSNNGSIQFVGGARYGADPNTFPGTGDGGPVNRYAAGTFTYTPGTYSGINALAATTVYPGSLNGGGAPNRLVTQGMGDVVLDQPSTGLERSTIETRGGGGRLIVANPATVAGATLNIAPPIYDGATQLKPPILVLASPDGNDVTYPNSIGATAGGSLVAGTGGVGVAGNGALILPNLKPTEGAIVRMKVTPGQADYILLPNGVNSPGYTQANALAHYGYHINNTGFANDLSASYFQASTLGISYFEPTALGLVQGGMWSTGKPASFQTFYGKEVLTGGPTDAANPTGRGLDYNDDYDFMKSGAIGQVDNYSNLFIGKLTVLDAALFPAAVNRSGSWTFRINATDDPSGIWIDLNRNGQFDSSIPGVADNRGEQLMWLGGAGQTGQRAVTLAAGEYMVAFTQTEGGGGSQIDIQFQAPGMGALATIKPSLPAQAGFWSMPTLGGGLDICQGEVRTGGALNLGTLILNPGGTLNRVSPYTEDDGRRPDRDITVTERLELWKDLSMIQGERLTTTGATVQINPGATLFIDHAVNAADLNIQGNLVRTGPGASANVTATRSMTLNTPLTFTTGDALTTTGVLPSGAPFSATINIGPSGSLTTSAAIAAKALASAGTVNAPSAAVTDLVLAAGTTKLTGPTAMTITGSLLGGNAATLDIPGPGISTLDLTGAKLVNLNSTLRVESGTLTVRTPTAGGALPSGLVAHYSAIASAVTGASNTVSRLYDLSDFGRDLGNVLGAPTYVASNNNGLPAIRFYATDGTDALWGDYNFDSLNEYSVVAVDRLTGGANARVITSRTRNWLFGHEGGGDGRWHAEGWISPAGGNSNTLWEVCAGTINALADPQGNFWYNGNQTGNNSTGSSNSAYKPGILQLGAWGSPSYNNYAQASNSEVSDILLFDRVLTAAERNAVASYLASRYAVTNTYAATPFSGPPLLGDLQLGPSAQANIVDSLGNQSSAKFNSISIVNATTGAAIGPVVSGGLTLGAPAAPIAPLTPNVEANASGDTLTLRATTTATNFSLTAPSTFTPTNRAVVELTRDLTIASTLTSAANTNITALNTLAVNANSASAVNLKGGLSVASGTLTVNLPAATTMPTGLAGWYDANDITNGGAQPANGAVITDWLDKSGNARNLGGAGQYNSDPNLNTAGPNGRSVVTFDGDDWIRSTYNFDPLTNYTVLTVGRFIGGDNERLVSSTGRNWLFGWHGGWEDRWHAEGWIYGEPPQPSQAATTNWRLYAGTMGPATSNPQASFWRDGILLTGGNIGSGDANYYIGQLELGAYNGTNETARGEVAEVLIFNRVLNATELNSVGGYLASKYGLSANYTGYVGLPSLGDLSLANTTGLVLGGGAAAAFQSITTTGPTATIQGAPTVTGDLRVGHNPASPTDIVIGNLAVTGNVTLAAGSTYHWQHSGAAGDLVAITGGLTTVGNVNVGVALGAVLPDGSYDIGTFTGTPTIGGGINVVKENAYAQLINSASVGIVPGAPNRVVLTLDMNDNILRWTSTTGTNWNTETHWTPNAPSGPPPGPTLANPTIVDTSTRVATVQAGDTGLSHSLIVDKGGHVLVEQGGDLQVANNVDVMGGPTGGKLTVNGRLGAGTTVITGVTPLNFSGLISYWAFDEGAGGTTANAVGGGPAGTLSNATWVGGKYGNALSFDGSSSSVGTGVSLLNNLTAFTMSGWVKPNTSADRIGTFGQNDLIEAGVWGGNQFAVWSNTAGGNVNAPFGFPPPAADWHHVAYVGSTSGLQIYVDGVLAGSGGGALAASTSGFNFNIGGDGIWDGPGTNWFNGLIDDVAVWNRALSAAEIQTLYQGLTTTLLGGKLTTAGTTTFGPYADIDVPKIDVIGGTTTSWPNQPPTLKAGTTLRLAGGNLAGVFSFSNPSTTAGSYAIEAEKGTSPAWLIGPTSSLRKTTADTVTVGGVVNLNSIRVEAGTLNLTNEANWLAANNVTVTGGTLASSKRATIGTLQLEGGTTILARDTRVTTGLGGGGTLITDGTLTLDASTAGVGLSGQLQVTSSVPAISGFLTVNVPTPSMTNAVSQDFDTPGGTPYVARQEGVAPGPTLVNDGLPHGNVMRMISSLNSQANSIAFDRTLTGTYPAISATFDMRIGSGADGGAFALLNTAIYGASGQGPNSPPWEEPNLASSFAVGFDVYDNIYEVSLHWAGAVRAARQVYDYRNKGWQPVNLDIRYAPGGANVWLDIAGNSIYSNYFIPGMTPYECRALVGARTGGLNTTMDVDNINMSMGVAMAKLGNVRLDPSAQLTLGGAGVASFDSIGTTGGPTATGPMVLGGAANLRGGNKWLTFNGTVNASSFQVAGTAGSGVGFMNNSSLTMLPGGALAVPAGVTVASEGNVLIDATQASTLNFRGALNVGSGTLTLNGPAPAPLPASPMARWAFDETTGATASDASGNNRFGTLINSPTWVPGGGMIGGALSFNDLNNYVTVPRTNNGGINIDNQSFSLSIWAKLSPTAVASDYFFGQGWSVLPDNTRRALHVGRRDTTNETIAFYADDMNWGNAAVVSDSTKWHNWVVTYNTSGNARQIWCDGALVQSGTSAGPFVAGGSTDFWIGQANNGNWFGGLLDEPTVYGRVLTPTEIQNLYRAGLQGGYGAARFGDLTMAQGTNLVAAAAPVGFSTATIGDGATMTGDITVDRRITPAGTNPGHFTVQGPSPSGPNGHLRISDSLAYEWSFNNGPAQADLIDVVGDLHFDKSFTLRIFGEGGVVLPTDWIPVFYADSLEVGGLPWNATTNPLQYTIEVGNLADPQHLYLWDISDATLQVLGQAGDWGIYLTGLSALAIPEPSTLTLLALGALALLRRRRAGRR